MTTIESMKKFGLEFRGIAGLILTGAGCAVILLGLAVLAADMAGGTFGLEGAVLFAFLFVFFGGGLALILLGRHKFRKGKERTDGLKEAWENGRFVMADVVAVRKETSTQKVSDNMFTGVRYREYYLVECRYDDPSSGRSRTFYSRGLYDDPTDSLTAAQVPVYVDKNDENNYFVDVDRIMAA